MKSVFIVGLVLALLAPTFGLGEVALAQDEERCVIVAARHYYAREIHDDYLLRQFELCLSSETKSVSYEVPALPEPLTLIAQDGVTISVAVEELSRPGEVFLAVEGQQVTFELPEQGTTENPSRYQLTVEVRTGSSGIIEGRFGDHVIGQILILENHRRYYDSLVIALGGHSGEWWFETTDRPVPGSLVFVAVIPEPTHGQIGVEWEDWRWIYDADRDHPTIILGNEWLPGGYMAIEATFPVR